MRRCPLRPSASPSPSARTRASRARSRGRRRARPAVRQHGKSRPGAVLALAVGPNVAALVRPTDSGHRRLRLRLRLQRGDRFVPARRRRLWIARALGQPAASAWWLDVETSNTWRSDTSLSVAALQGEVAYFSSVAHVAKLGIYSTQYQWNQIAGGSSAFPRIAAGWPGWEARRARSPTAVVPASPAVASSSRSTRSRASTSTSPANAQTRVRIVGVLHGARFPDANLSSRLDRGTMRSCARRSSRS